MPSNNKGIRRFFSTEAATNNDDASSGDDREDESDEINDTDSFIDNDDDDGELLVEVSPKVEKKKRIIRNSEKKKRIIRNSGVKKVGAKPSAAPMTAAKNKKNNAAAALLLFASKKEKLPGDITFPVSSWSITITKAKDDVPLQVLDIMHQFLQQYCLKGAVSTEVGSRAHKYHVQGMMTLHYPTSPPFKKSLSILFYIV